MSDVNTEFDAIVVGSGMSGGWVAKELCERGLKVLVLERGKNIEHGKDYSDNLAPWQEDDIQPLTLEETKNDYPIQSTSYAFLPGNRKFWVKDSDHPYQTPDGKPYNWMRGYHLGGRSLMWGRQSYRLSPMDFEANKRDGHGVDWPIRYDDLAKWYDKVETFAGISGTKEGLPQLPDGNFLPPFEMTCVEEHIRDKVEATFPGRRMIPGRTANLRTATPEQMALGRIPCQARKRCENGCSFGAYFSSLSATLPAAKRTENMTVITDAIVQSLEHNEAGDRVTGVRVIDQNTKVTKTYRSKIVFLNASAIASSMILLNSASDKHPTGLANGSDQVGRNLMDHVGGGWAHGYWREGQDRYYYGRRPNVVYVPRYTNLNGQDHDFLRGYGFQGFGYRQKWSGNYEGIGEEFKLKNRDPGDWHFWLFSFGEALPNPNNRVTLHSSKTDQWGMPVAVIDAAFGENERKITAQASKDAKAMLEAAGLTDITSSEDSELKMSKPGSLIHEMGTARMGHDPKTSVLNRYNQAHQVKNLFITDGACMTSSACQNPSLTYMALSARAANIAADMLAEGSV